MPDPTPATPPSTPPPAPIPPASSPSAQNKVVDTIYKLLAAAVVPLVIWGINLHSDQATQELRIATLEKEMEEVKPHATSLVRLEEQMKAVNLTLIDIKGILNRPPIQ